MKHLIDFEKINEEISLDVFKRQLDEIDKEKQGYNYYVGYIKRKPGKKVYAWTWDGIFKGFVTKEEVLEYIEKLKSEGINDTKIMSPKEYEEINKVRRRGQ
jgi:hypothetical protein